MFTRYWSFCLHTSLNYEDVCRTSDLIIDQHKILEISWYTSQYQSMNMYIYMWIQPFPVFKQSYFFCLNSNAFSFKNRHKIGLLGGKVCKYLIHSWMCENWIWRILTRYSEIEFRTYKWVHPRISENIRFILINFLENGTLKWRLLLKSSRHEVWNLRVFPHLKVY